MSGQVQTLTSASGLLSLLDEEERELQYYGLTQLEAVADVFWTEISDSITKIEVLYEDESFEHRKLAGLVASKIYFHLGEFDDALNFALGAGDLFRLEDTSAYVQTVVNHAIDKYIELRSDEAEVDGRLETVVERMVERCFEAKDYAQVVGLSIEARRLDILERALASGDTKSLLAYVQRDCIDLIGSVKVQRQVQELVVKVLMQLEEPDYEAICAGLSKLSSAETTAGILRHLAEGDEAKVLSAYQIAFDLNASASQEFTKAVAAALEPREDGMAEGGGAALGRIRAILGGGETLRLHLEFLFRNNRTDMRILNHTCKLLDSRHSLAHSAVSLANAFMHAGTTVDSFLRDNLEWLSRASNWSKFTATAALGVIHRGHVRHGFRLLQPYLPEGASVSPYSEGGALFALGLIHASHGTDRVVAYLRDALVQFAGAAGEVVQHGACLGLGAAALGAGGADVAQALLGVLYADSAVAGEAAALGLGLALMGSNDARALDEMLAYARETEHEKIIRALAVGVGLVAFGRKQDADALVARLLQADDALLRLGAVHALAMAYCGTGDNGAIRRLLHLAVSDVKDDVRRAAVAGLGFVMLRSPEHVPRMVELLSQSFNPHVRAGAALALGIACAGSGAAAAVAILEPLARDAVDFVVEAAVIALAFVLIQQNDAYDPKVADVRKRFAALIDAKHGEGVTKFGAAVAQGIIDAGGRNVTIALASADGQLDMAACAGMLLFTQFWYWFPLAHFLALAFKPTALIAVTRDLRLPSLDAVCVARRSLFAYPAALEPPTAAAPAKIATAVLSTTARARRGAKKGEDAMDVEPAKPVESMDVDEGSDAKALLRKGRKVAESPFAVANMTRVLPYQERFVKWPAGSRYVPVKQGAVSGVLVVRDTMPEKPEEFIASSLDDDLDDEEEAPAAGADVPLPPPEPFEYPFDGDRQA
ncbi:proteasome regulatory particle base subunit [Coemansia linderi]|uniref:Proteasome regulatory particle base subunit n=1 Tax=Coemansia linderi TaxID=2663919 RepID=A0ACC1KH51_9FUNG|nr:proteasome regulatory particle base subunit [Coemansia linderi]